MNKYIKKKFSFKLILLFFHFLLSLTFVSAYNLTPNIELYAKFDNSLVDSTGNGYTFSNFGATSDTDGKINRSYYFDGINDYMTNSFRFSGSSFTFNVWVNSTSSGIFRGILRTSGDWNLINYNNRITSYSSTGGYLTYLNSSNYSNNKYFMVTMVLESGVEKAYINGQFVGSVTRNPTSFKSTFIVGDSNFDDRYFNGSLDEMGVWSVALNSSQITELYYYGVGCQYNFSYCEVQSQTLQTNLSSFVSSSNFSVSVNTSNNVNLSYYIDNNNLNIEDNLVLYYNAENTSDSVTGLNNGTINGGSIEYQVSPNGYGRNFYLNGSQYVSTSNFGITGDVTQCALVNFDSLTGDQAILSKVYGSTSGARNGKLGISGGYAQYYLRNTSGDSITITATDPLNANQYYYICGVTEGTTGKLYIDGVLNASDTILGTLATGVSDFEVGAKDSGSGTPDYITGNIDEVKIFNVSLNDSQIFNLYETTPYIRIYNNSNNGTFDVTDISLGSHNLTYVLSYGSVIQTFNYSFIYDTQLPNITNNINDTYYKYNNIFFNSSCSDTNLDYCNISINSQNVELNVSSFNFTSNGNISYTITAKDLAGNIVNETGYTFINPKFYVYFENESSDIISNFSINGTNYNEYFEGFIYDYGLGTHTFNFSKSGYDNYIFNLTFNSSSDINITLNVDLADITIYIKDVDTGNLTTPNNYTILINNVDTAESYEYTITNNNTLIISNFFETESELSISVIQNDSIISSVAVIPPREDIEVNLYVTTRETENRQFEVLSPSLSVIPNSYVYVYIYIEGVGFVLQSQKKTNNIGQVTFPIIPNVKTYNICNIYEGAEKCLTQVIFTDVTTDPYQIIHDPDLTSVENRILNYISYSFSESKTNTSTTATFNFNDAQALVDSFCYNVTRTTNSTSVSKLGSFCVNSYAGSVVQTFSLNENQYIDFTLYYVVNNQTAILNKFRSYYESAGIEDLKDIGILSLAFLVIYFSVMGFGLKTNRFEFYNVVLLGSLLVISIVQAYFNSSFVLLGVWGLLLSKTILFYTTKYGD